MSKFSTLYSSYGQALWLDYIDRDLLVNGGLEELVNAGVRGVTSNPTIFHKAISAGHLYDDSIRDLLQADAQVDAQTLYQWLTVQDVQDAADILAGVYDSSDRADGYVSLEVSPHLAHNSEATVAAARHLWRMVDRANLMIKVPATRAGVAAIETLIGEGINVNATLLFSGARYAEVMDAYIGGLERCDDPHSVASVASFFISRVDGMVDSALTQIDTAEALALRGHIAIANARLAYSSFTERFARPDFERQRRRGARVQRPLWASTSTKNPDYRDVLYVESLIGPDTVNTLPPATLDAFQTHGEMRTTLEQGGGQAEQELRALAELGVDLAQVAEELERDGVAKFADSYDALLALLDQKRFDVSREYASG
jgi:transaldolase